MFFFSELISVSCFKNVLFSLKAFRYKTFALCNYNLEVLCTYHIGKDCHNVKYALTTKIYLLHFLLKKINENNILKKYKDKDTQI